MSKAVCSLRVIGVLRTLDCCGHKLLNILLQVFSKYVSTRDPSSAIFLLKNYACVFTKAKKTGAVQSFCIRAFVTLPGIEPGLPA